MNNDPPGASTSPATLTRGDNQHVAFHLTTGRVPGVIFLGGFRSDMTGTKAQALESACTSAGRSFVRFDYFGHGQSSGDFTDGTIGRWRDDALAVLDELTTGPQVLVGSSMGGWIMLLLAMARPERIAGLIGIAAAPDFTETLMWPSFGESIRRQLETEGLYLEPSPYDPEPTPITMKLITEARAHLVLADRIPFSGPVRLIQGTADQDVPWQHALRLADALASEDVTVTLVKGGDHRMSSPAQLDLMCRAVDELCRRASADAAPAAAR